MGDRQTETNQERQRERRRKKKILKKNASHWKVTWDRKIISCLAQLVRAGKNSTAALECLPGTQS